MTVSSVKSEPDARSGATETAEVIADLDEGLMSKGIAYASKQREYAEGVKAVVLDADGAPWIAPESGFENGWVTWADNRCSMMCGVGYQE